MESMEKTKKEGRTIRRRRNPYF
nr:unnamed protein product [Callosobruchus chinensis]